MTFGLNVLAALADASTDPNEIQANHCSADGPGGDSCCRDRGHRDTAWRQNIHVGFAADQYQEWPVGWRTLTERVDTVLDPGFGQHLVGSPEYLAGFHDCLQLVTQNLRATATRPH